MVYNVTSSTEDINSLRRRIYILSRSHYRPCLLPEAHNIYTKPGMSQYNVFYYRISICLFPYLLHSFYNDVNICVTSYCMYEVSHEGKLCTKYLNQHNFICRKCNKLYKYSINISHNKIMGLWNNFNNLKAYCLRFCWTILTVHKWFAKLSLHI